MQTIRWLSFGASHAMSRSVLHFFPSSENASAPYTASCSVSIFGSEIPKTSVMLEGARLGHPDGVRLEDAFAPLRQGASGVFGIEVEVSTSQPRIDVDASECLVEVVFQGQPVRFSPKCTTHFQPITQKGGHAAALPFLGSALALEDGTTTSSIVLVNGSEKNLPIALLPATKTTRHGLEATVTGSLEPLAQRTIGARSVCEVPLSAEIMRTVTAQELTWGQGSALPIAVVVTSSEGLPPEVQNNTAEAQNKVGNKSRGEKISSPHEALAAFMVFRDPTSKRVVSVVPFQ